MPKVETLADYLGVPDPRPEEKREGDFEALADIKNGTEFCQKIVETREWRQYIMNGVVLGDLPAAVATRIMDHAWGKPPERIEHTGKDGNPIVTEVRRVIIRAEDLRANENNEQHQFDEPERTRTTTTH